MKSSQNYFPFSLENAVGHSYCSATREAGSTKRQAEFAAGRFCAAQALQKAGFSGTPIIGTRSNRAPDWPQGWVGSITHTSLSPGEAFVSAVVARAEKLRSIGVDSEQIMESKTASDVESLLLNPCEKALFENESNQHLDFLTFLTLIFSVKESVFKCLNPLVSKFFEFHDVAVRKIRWQEGEVDLELLTPLSPEFGKGYLLCGRFALNGRLVHTLVEVAHE